MKRAKRGRSRWGAALRLLRAVLPTLAVASGAWAQEEESFEIEEEGGYEDEAKRRELTTQGSEIELGFLWNADDSNAFGDFTGLANEGFFVLGNADVRYRTAWDDPDPMNLRLRALNLGLDSREAFAEWERPGRYGAYFEFDQVPKYWNEQGRIPFFKQGDSVFTLPAACVMLGDTGCWQPGNNPAGMTNLAEFLREVDSRYLRRSFGGGIYAVLPENLDFSAAYDHQDRWGRYFTGATMGLTGGNPRAVTLPERVDETTHTWETALGWAIEALQLDLQYLGSRYENHEDSVTWVNPYLAHPQWNAAAGFPALGRKDQAPDNWFHQIIASGGYQLPWNTRITGNAAFGWMLQDDGFLPYTVNPALAAPIALPRSDLNGRIDTTLLNFQVASRPLEKVRLDLRYRYDDRDNETPRDTYVYIRNDSEDQGAINSDQARRNRPYSYTQHAIDFEAGYTVFQRTELTLGYDWTQTQRDLQEAKEVWEHGVGAQLWSRPWNWLTARAHYRHGWRDHASYKGVKPQLEGWSPEFLATFNPATDFDQHPLLRKYYMAKAQTDEVGALFTLSPLETVGIGIHVDWSHDDYFDSDLGLTDREGLSSGVDVSWAATERFYTHAFYAYDRFRSDQESWSWAPPTVPPPDPPQFADPTRRWESEDKDRGHTVGAGFHVELIPERLGLDTQYLFSWIRGTIGVDRGAVLGADFPYPNERTRIHSTSVRLDFQATEQIGMRVGYLFERMSTRDWALDGVEPGGLTCTATCAIVSGQRSPEDTSHLVTWSLVYDFFW
jgi:MtrB/PioB family decaheme-associated outer membrane protein